MFRSSSTNSQSAIRFFFSINDSSAVDLLESAAKQAPDNASIHYHLGMCYQKMNRTADARQHLAQALKLDPNATHAAEIRAALGQS